MPVPVVTLVMPTWRPMVVVAIIECCVKRLAQALQNCDQFMAWVVTVVMSMPVPVPFPIVF